MNYKVVESVWLAVAVMTYETFKENRKLKLEDICFRQVDIQKRASIFSKDHVEAARISQWCNADHKNNIHNYLRDVKGKRRLTFTGECNGVKERPIFNDMEAIIPLSSGENITIKQLLNFVDTEYTPMFFIDFISILEYIKNFSGKAYRNPRGVEDEEKEKLLRIKQAGSAATNELNKFANLCESKFTLKNQGKSKWLNGGNDKVRSYLWNQLKYESKLDYPSSISIFAELVNGQAQLRIAVELDEKEATTEDYKRHHQLLNIEINKEISPIYYFIKETNNPRNNVEIHHESAKQIKKKVEDGTYKKVQLVYVLTKEQIDKDRLSNKDILKALLEGFESLIPFYKLAIDYPPDNLNNRGEKKMYDSKNTILYGPPGTGKTYNTVIYAVSIIEKKRIEEVAEEKYSDVFERYTNYKKQGKIAFVTFHQSYGYEEFIEGIKPNLDTDETTSANQLEYTIEPGIFKKFCDNARRLKVKTPQEGVVSEIKIWKVSLKGSGQNEVKDDCFMNNRIRIGWKEVDQEITDESKFPSEGVKRILTKFYDEMNIGDIVFSLYDQKHIDGIGFITGNPEWLVDGGDYPRSRSVKWIAKNIKENVYDLNANTNLTLSTVYQLKRLNLDDVNKLILKYSKNQDVTVEENKSNYVFIIDEINRGNISKIFGELITLIESTKRIGEKEETKVKLPYSKEEFGVPNNVYLLGTMNTADRSIALIDTALRRRFNFVEMMPDEDVVKDIIVGTNININLLLKAINARIELLYDREHTIGHAYFMCLKDDPSIDKLALIFRNSIIPLLQEYFYEDYSKIQLVLGDNGKETDFKFILDEKIHWKSFFKGNTDIDLPERKYRIQTAAFYKEESYIQIYD